MNWMKDLLKGKKSVLRESPFGLRHFGWRLIWACLLITTAVLAEGHGGVPVAHAAGSAGVQAGGHLWPLGDAGGFPSPTPTVTPLPTLVPTSTPVPFIMPSDTPTLPFPYPYPAQDFLPAAEEKEVQGTTQTSPSLMTLCLPFAGALVLVVGIVGFWFWRRSRGA